MADVSQIPSSASAPAVVCVTDPDIEQALRDRRTLIEERARSLTLNALQNGDPWTLSLGRPAADPDRREEWLRQLDTVAAYRDRWQVRGPAVLGTEPRSYEQLTHQQCAQHAMSTALEIGHTTDVAREASVSVAIEPGGR